jgi:hypothetical protein
MQRTPRTRGLRLLAAVLLAAAGGPLTLASAQEPEGLADSAPQLPRAAYALYWYSVDGGGSAPDSGRNLDAGPDADRTDGVGAGGPAPSRSVSPYALGATIGQPDAGTLLGGSYTLVGGFWAGAPPALPGFELYLPVIMHFDS